MIMKYNFDKIPNRRGTNSLKWDVDRKELPMWVADMDFETVPEVQEALVQRVAHGVYGYSVIPDEWADSYVNWWEKRHHFRMDPKKLIFTTGVIPALSSAVRKLTTPAENVLIQTPVYNNFFNSIRNNGRNVVENELLYDGKEYRVDWEKLEQQLADPQTTLMILCNPQNPAGNIWDCETLARIGALCKQYDVIVVSDEIHCDLTKPGTEYIPFASVDDTCRDISVTCIAPTKTFNLAGLVGSYHIVYNSYLRDRLMEAEKCSHYNSANVLSISALMGAYTKEGAEWVDELREVLTQNVDYAYTYITTHFEGVSLIYSSLRLTIDKDKIREREPRPMEVLVEVIDKLKNKYDVILLDTPPSLEILTSNALACSTDYIIPIFSGSQYGMYGVVELQRYIDSLKRINPTLNLLGALLVRHDERQLMCRNIRDELKIALGKVIPITIPSSAKIDQAAKLHLSISDIDTQSSIARQFRELAKWVAKEIGFISDVSTSGQER